jgi:NAD(P)-dependent dehydrogenase (short-subunit alcohol dehydrogenase family)
MNRLDGKVAVITGGVSGIGEGTVRLFVEEGARVVVADVQDERGHNLIEDLGASSAAYVHADVGDEEQVKGAVGAAVERFGRLDCIFNNAGFAGVSGPIEETDMEGYDRTMGVLVKGVFLGMKYTAPLMKAQGSGSIINTASVVGLRTGMGPHVYSMAKAAVVHLTRSVAMELGEAGVRVNCICPGFIMTEIFKSAIGLSDELWPGVKDFLTANFATVQPIKRMGMPRDIANAALFLASDDSSFVNGHALVVDGGLIGGRQWSEGEERRAQLAQALSQFGVTLPS